MKKMLLLMIVAALPVLAQPVAPDVAAQREAIRKLDFLTGHWEGAGWDQRGPKKTEFRSLERVQPKAGGTLLVIEGNHVWPEGSFDAFGVVSWNEASKTYEFRSFTSEGRSSVNEMKIAGERKVEWGFTVPQGQIRYALDLSDADRWVEIGEFSRDGKEWRKFFEMSLRRVK